MRRVAIWGACALCVAAVSTVVAQQSDEGSSGRDYNSSRYDRGSDQSSWSSGQSRSDPYSDRSGQSRSDIYDRSRDQSLSGQRGTDQSGRPGSTGQSQYGRDYEGRYGYRGETDTGEWSTGRGMQQGMGQQWRQRGQDWSTQDQGFGEEGMGRGMMGRGQGVAVVGRLTREDAQLSGVNPDHKLVQIQTRQGNTLYVDLGPSEQAQDLNLAQNQSIFVHGHVTNISGQRVLMARQVARVSQLTTIDRSQEGFSRGQQRSRDIYGYQDESGMRGQSQFGQPGQSSQFRSQGRSGQSQFDQPSTSGQSGSSQWNQPGQSGTSGDSSSSSGQQSGAGGSGQSSGSGQSGSSGSSGR